MREKLQAELGGKPDDQQQLQKAYTALGTALASSKDREKAIRAHRRALAISEKLAVEFPPKENYRMEAGHTMWQLGYLAADVGRHQEAEKYQRGDLAVFEKLAADFPQNRFYRQEQGYSPWNIAGLMRRQNRLPDAEKSYRDAVDVYSKLVVDAPNEAVYREREAVSRLNLAGVSALVGRPKEAEQQYAKILELSPSASAHNNACSSDVPRDKTPRPGPRGRVGQESGRAGAQPQGIWWNTLGVAKYRAGDWKAAVEALKKSMEFRSGGDSFDWFFLAMANWQLGNKDEARKWYDKGAGWMHENKKDDEELKRFRAEATDLLGSKLPPARPTISVRRAHENWAYARSWRHNQARTY